MPPCGCAPSWRKRSSIWTACRSDVALTLARDLESHRRGADPGIFAAAVRRRPDRDHRLRPGAGSADRHRPPPARERGGERRLVQSLDVPAVAALLVNPDAKIRKETHGPHRRAGRGDQRLAPAAGAARRSVGPRHPPHRRLCRRRASSSGWRRATICRDATRIHLNRELRARLAEAPTSKPDDAHRRADRGGARRRRKAGWTDLCGAGGPGRPARGGGPGAGGSWPMCPSRRCRRSWQPAAPSRWWRWSGTRICPCASRSRSRPSS